MNSENVESDPRLHSFASRVWNIPTCQELIIDFLKEERCTVALILSKATFAVAVRSLYKDWGDVGLEQFERDSFSAVRLKYYLSAVRTLDLRRADNSRLLGELQPDRTTRTYAHLLNLFPNISRIINYHHTVRIFRGNLWAPTEIEVDLAVLSSDKSLHQNDWQNPSEIPSQWRVRRRVRLDIHESDMRLMRPHRAETRHQIEATARPRIMKALRAGTGVFGENVWKFESQVPLNMAELITTLREDTETGARRVPNTLGIRPTEMIDSKLMNSMSAFVSLGVTDLKILDPLHAHSHDRGLREILENTDWAAFRGLRRLQLNLRGPHVTIELIAGDVHRSHVDWTTLEPTFNVDQLSGGAPLHLDTFCIRLCTEGDSPDNEDWLENYRKPKNCLPSLTALAKAALAIGGPLCEYTLCLHGMRLSSKLSSLLVKPFRKEVAKQVQAIREADAGGWSWMGKKT